MDSIESRLKMSSQELEQGFVEEYWRDNDKNSVLESLGLVENESQEQKDERIKTHVAKQFKEWHDYFLSESREMLKSSLAETMYRIDPEELLLDKSSEELEQFWVKEYWNIRGIVDREDRDSILQSLGLDPIEGESPEQKDERINTKLREEFQEWYDRYVDETQGYFQMSQRSAGRSTNRYQRWFCSIQPCF